MSSVGPTIEEVRRRLAARTLELVDVPSESGDEGAMLEAIRTRLPDRFEVLDDRDTVLFAVPGELRPGAPFVVLAGHVDTVPDAGTLPGSSDGDVVLGRGAADMKGALAVMVELAEELARRPQAELEVGLCFFGREELPWTKSALMPLFDRCPPITTADLAIVMEPTGNAIEIGCLGNLNATVTIEGRAAHSARPWQGENAIHGAIAALAPLADLPDRDVTIDGLTYREVLNVTTIEGGVAANVIPDRVRARVNYRYAPGHTPREAEDRLRELLEPSGADVLIDGNAPPGPVNLENPLVDRLRVAGELAVRSKQAWTPVAEFAVGGVDAINFGPGDPQYAHRDDERVEVDALVRCLDVMRRFIGSHDFGAADERGEAAS
ncbi:MAG: succinyl-diaminopimelate desuccinylase [Actinomycetota bacterium]